MGDSNSLRYLEKAQHLFSLGEFARSNDLCDLLIRDGFRTATLLYVKSLNLVRLNKLEEAGEYLRKCLAISPQNVQAWTDLAFVYSCLSNESEALVAYERAIGIDPNYSPACNGLA